MPGLPVSSLGIKKGDQLIVRESTSREIAQSPPRPIGGPGSATGVNPPRAQNEDPFMGRQALGDDYVQTDGGVLVHRVCLHSNYLLHRGLNYVQVVPDDNSCLFSSVGVVFEQDMSAAPRLRQRTCLSQNRSSQFNGPFTVVAAQRIRDDPDVYSDVLLG